MDKNSGRRFLVDTGAEVSLLPASSDRNRNTPGLSLQAANNSTIPTYGTRSLTLDLYLALFHIGTSKHRYPGS